MQGRIFYILRYAFKPHNFRSRAKRAYADFADTTPPPRTNDLDDILKGRQLVVWGAGEDSKNFLKDNSLLESVDFFVSRDYLVKPKFLEKRVCDKSILSKDKHYVIILTSKFRDEIKEELKESGCEFWSYQHAYLLPFKYKIKNVPIGKFSYFPTTFTNSILIKSIGSSVSINGIANIHRNHRMDFITTGYFPSLIPNGESKYPTVMLNNKVSIGNDVWIGANAFINASKVKSIGDGAIVGTGAVVMQDVPPYAVMVGCPARILRYRFSPEQIEILQRVRWWDWSNEELEKNAELLFNPKLFFERFK